MSTTNLKEQQDIQSIINKKGLIIAGPCSAESEEQLLETAKALAATGKVDIIRGGIWKPRTRPGTFEGIGVCVSFETERYMVHDVFGFGHESVLPL